MHLGAVRGVSAHHDLEISLISSYWHLNQFCPVDEVTLFIFTVHFTDGLN